MTATIRLLLVDDHPVVRDGLRGQLQTQQDLHVVAEAATAGEALAVLGHRKIDVLVTDLRMPGIDGLDLIAAAREGYPDVEILVLSTYDAPDDITAALDAGARSYLLKDTGRTELYEAIRATARGRSVLSPSARTERANASPEPTALSPREHQVLRLVAAGRTNAQIAVELFIGDATVKTHLQHIFAKLGASDRAEAVSIGHRRGLL